MNILDRPYFLNDKDWYYWDKNAWTYKLTDKAPKEAIDSYNKFYKEVKNEQ